jgi:integrase
LRENYERRFRRPREAKYGTTNKGFTEMELQHFLRNVKNDKFWLLFKFRAFLGLSIGEVTKLHVSNIDFEKMELTIMSEKSRKLDSLLIPADLFREAIEFANKNAERIKAANRVYLFDYQHYRRVCGS